MDDTRLSRRAAVAAAFGSVAAAALTHAASAENYPTKPITIISPFGPGTTNDIIARVVGQEMMGTLGQPVVVEDRAGATGNIATDLVSKAKPDGYTLLLASMSGIINQATGNASTDLIKDFSPISFCGKGLYSMFVPNDLPVKTVADLIELARKQPGKLNYAGYVGGVPQFLGEMLNRAAKINTVMVSYKSTPDALADLMANRIQIWFTPVASGIPVQNGKQARMIAVTGETRTSMYPDVPTFKESGYPDLTVEVAYYLLAAKNTPKPIVDKLYAAVDKALQTPKTKENLFNQGVEEKRGGPDELGTYLAAEMKRWQDIVRLSVAPSVGR